MIRKATTADAPAIRRLFDQLGHPTKETMVPTALSRLIDHPDHHVLVFEADRQLAGFISMHIVPQLAFEGPFGIITCLVVGDQYQRHGVGKELEMHCTLLARDLGCERMQLHCGIHRLPGLDFYEDRGYVETRKYYTKQLRYPDGD